MDRPTLRRFADGSIAEQFREIQEWRAQWRVPRFIMLVDADNELPIDPTTCLASMHSPSRHAAGLVRVGRDVPWPKRACAKGPEGYFVHEIVARSGCRGTDVPAGSVARGRPHASAPSARSNGCIQVLLRTSSVDSCHGCDPSTASGGVRGRQHRWFFVRYADPHWHLRVRLRGRPDLLRSGVLGAIEESMGRCLSERRTWKTQIDTYEREIERYGGDKGMLFSEEWFWIDSDATLDILCLLAGDQGIDARWRLALRSWDLMLSDLGFEMPDKLKFVRESRDMIARSLGVTKALDRAIGDRFRTHRRSLEALFNDLLENDDPVHAAAKILRRRSDRLRPVAQRPRDAAADGQLTVSLQTH